MAELLTSTRKKRTGKTNVISDLGRATLDLSQVFTTNEIAPRWGITQRAIQLRFERNPDLVSELERKGLLRLSIYEGQKKGIWLITYKAMEIVFGPEPIRD